MIEKSSSSLMGKAFDGIRPRLTTPRAPVFVAVRFMPAHEKIPSAPQKSTGFTRVIRMSTTLMQWLLLITLGIGAAAIVNTSRTSQLFTVVSGSMEPAIQTGSIIAVGEKGDAYAAGDIIAFRASQGIITHRIAQVLDTQESPMYVTKGDANSAIDAAPIPHALVIGEAKVVAPYAGYILQWLRTKIGFAFLILLPATFVILQELASMRRAWQQLCHPTFAARTAAVLLLLATTVPATFALLTTSANMPSNHIATADIFPTVTPSPEPSSSPEPTPTPSVSPTVSPEPTAPVCDVDIEIDQENSNTGAGSTNENTADINRTCTTTIEHETAVTNEVNIDASTGNNTSNNNTSVGTQTTGDITVDIAIQNE